MAQTQSEILLSLVIPVVNEEKRIMSRLKRADEYLASQKYTYEIIVVDDGSADNTWNIITEFADGKPNFVKLKNSANIGKGGSIQRGVAESKGEYVLFSDADFSAPVEEIEKLEGIILDEFLQCLDVLLRIGPIGGRNSSQIFRHAYDPSHQQSITIRPGLVGKKDGDGSPCG